MRRLDPHDSVILGYLAVITALVLAFHSRIDVAWVLLLDHALVAGLILLLAAAQERYPNRFWRVLHDWYPLLLVPMAFRELHYLVHPINPVDADHALRAWDRWLFGVDPTVWLQAWTTPFLTEILQLVYSSYYFMPIGLVVLLYLRGDRAAYHETLTAILLGFFLSYFGYFLVPALGPRLTMTADHSLQLQGVWFYHHLRAGLDSLELEMRDCFPSGHTEIALLVLIYGWKFHRRYFWALLVPVLLLVLSTVYLRYHYVVDVMAGALQAALVPTVTAAVLRLAAPARARAGAPATDPFAPAPAGAGVQEKLLT